MFKSLSEINFEWLKANHTRIYFFGLGFIQVKINETYRLHFYIPELPSFVDHPHNHRYDFESFILKGSFTNIIYKEIPGNDFLIREDSCSEGFMPDKEPRKSSFKMVSKSLYKVGQSYKMDYKTFHSVKAESCVTLLKRSEYKKDLAEVSTPINQEKVCPFKSKLSEEFLWTLIKKELS